MRWRLAAVLIVAALMPGTAAHAQKGCKPSQYQLCLDLPPPDQLQGLDSGKASQSQNFQQLRTPSGPASDPAHDRRMKLDDNTSVGLGRGGIGIKRSF